MTEIVGVQRTTSVFAEGAGPVTRQAPAETAVQAGALNKPKEAENSASLEWPSNTKDANLSDNAIMRGILRELREAGVTQSEISSKQAMLAQLEKVSAMKDASSLKIGPLVMAGLKMVVAPMAALTQAVAPANAAEPMSRLATVATKVAPVLKHSATGLDTVTPVINGAIQYHEQLAQAEVQERDYNTANAQRSADKSSEYLRNVERSITELLNLEKEASNSNVRAYQSAATI